MKKLSICIKITSLIFAEVRIISGIPNKKMIRLNIANEALDSVANFNRLSLVCEHGNVL